MTDSNNKNPDIIIAKNAIKAEIDGLNQLHDWIGNDFAQAISLIAGIKGTIILSGMGKSGHIGKKIAATLSSTGNRAFFIHPSEASHGDLGMINKNDVIILLSNSGETIELKDIINYAKRLSIPLIAIVRRKTSILAEAADIALILPDSPEASIINAPTTSTTMMLALGDALAVALLERKGFTQEDFGKFHPGGKLGSAFTKVKDIMHKGEELPLADYNDPMSHVLVEMTRKSLGCIAILEDDGKLAGIITDGDLRRHLKGDDLLNKLAHQIMTKNPVTIGAEKLATEALAIMQERSITGLFILQDAKPVGIIHIHDLLRNKIY